MQIGFKKKKFLYSFQWALQVNVKESKTRFLPTCHCMIYVIIFYNKISSDAVILNEWQKKFPRGSISNFLYLRPCSAMPYSDCISIWLRVCNDFKQFLGQWLRSDLGAKIQTICTIIFSTLGHIWLILRSVCG